MALAQIPKIPDNPRSSRPMAAPVPLNTKSSWSLTLGGDIMLNGINPKVSPLGRLSRYLSHSSVNLANLEIPLTDVGARTSRKKPEELRKRHQFVLRASPMHARWIREAGIDGVSLGNNHAMDYGADGLNCMEQALDKAGVGCTGAGRNLSLARQVIVKTLPNGVRVGLISALAFATPKALFVCTPATPQSPGVNPFDPKSAAEWISEAHRACDVLVVALHGGVERRPVPNAAQRAFAHLCIDAGADVIWGHHPHVLEGAELYHGKPILYSMGNLISSLPASSGLVKLIFSGNKVVKSEFLPLLIAQGRVTPLVGSQRVSSFRNWLSLGLRSRRAPESPMPFTLAKVP